MRIYGPFALVPWIAVALLAHVALRPGVPAPDVEVAEQRAAGAPLCGAHDCGCPHEVVPASCCCAGEVENAPAAAPRARVVADVSRSGTAADISRPVVFDAVPGGVIESRECSGPSRGRASASVGSAPVALVAPPAVIVESDDAGWMPALGDGPPFDLGTEPPTPPPRGTRG